MRESKTHFEQIPVSVVKKIAEEFHDVAENPSAVTRTLPGKLKPHRAASLGKQRNAALTIQPPEPEINCSICGKQVALETAKTDEAGQAAHDGCYLLKLGITADGNSAQAHNRSISTSEHAGKAT